MSTNASLYLSALLVILASCLGCAEGPLWKTGKYAPWVQSKWAEEEKIADTLYSRKRDLSEKTSAVVRGPINDQERVAKELSEEFKRSRIVLLRLHAVQLLGQLNCPTAVETLTLASNDNHRDIRLAAINAWRNMPADKAIPHLQQMLGSDTDIDVRLAATRALANFQGPKAIAAIEMALNDPDPALQLRATESLEQVTGEKLGRDVQAWKQFAQRFKSSTAGNVDHTATGMGFPLIGRKPDSDFNDFR